MKRKPIPPKVIETVLERSGGLCEEIKEDGQRCCFPVMRNGAPHHIVFKSHLGKDTEENVMAICGQCHAARHGRREIWR